jgi:hypothetical protein
MTIKAGYNPRLRLNTNTSLRKKLFDLKRKLSKEVPPFYLEHSAYSSR